MSPRHEFVRVPRRTYYPVVAPASVETLRLNRYDKWTDNDQTVISDRACVLGTRRWGLAHGGLPTPQVSQDPVALFIPRSCTHFWSFSPPWLISGEYLNRI